MIKKIFKNFKKGFTIVELMVVSAIIITVSTLALFNSSSLNSAVLLSNNAYEISLIVRDAQISGLGARVLLSDENMATTSNQGVYFNILDPEKIIIFADLDKNNLFTPGEESQVYTIQNKRAGNIIKICKISNSDNSCEEVTDLNIIFKRPNPESYFYFDSDGSGLGYQGSVSVNLGFVNSDCRTILIYKTGAIQIDKSFCD